MERDSRAPGTRRLAAVVLALAAALAAAGGAGAAAPSNDRFTSALPLIGEGGEVHTTNVGATAEAGEPRHVSEAAEHSVWFRWTAPVTGSFVIDTCDSSFDTLLAVYEGTAISSLASVGESDDECGDRSALTIAVEAGESYAIAVDGYDGETGAIVLRWSRVEPPSNDAIASAIALEGTGGEREATVAGATREPGEPSDVGRLQGSVWFVWAPPSDGFATISVPETSFDSSIAVYAGDSTRGLHLVRANEDRNQRTSAVALQVHAGTTYRIAVRGTAPVGGGWFTLRWARPQPPENDRPEQARFVWGEAGTVTATTIGASIEGPERAASWLGEEAGSVWFAWRAPHDGPASAQVCGASGARGVAVFAGEASVPLVSRSGTCGDARAGFSAAAGVLYRLAVVGPRERSATFRVTWGYPPPNDEFERAQDLGSAAGGAVAGSTVGATIEDEEPLPDDADASGSAWYAWRAPATGWTAFDTCGSGFDTVLAVYAGDALPALAQLAVDDDSCASAASRVRLRTQQGTVYRIAVRGFEHDSGRFELHWQPSPVPANDAFARATLLRGANGSTTGTTIGTSRERGEPPHVGRTTGTAWFRWIAPATRWESFATCGSGFDTVVAVYPSGPLARLTPLDVSDDDCEAGGIVRFAAERGVEYRIAVTGYRRQDEFVLSWRSIAPPPCVVPDVVGRPLSVARTLIEDAHCRVGAIRVVRLELVRRGTVVGQTPQDRRPVRRPHGARVRLEVAGS